MKIRILVLLSVLFLSLNVSANSTYRVGYQVLVRGDSATHVIELMGEPAYKEPIQNEFSAYVGQRWQYLVDNRTVTFIIINGRVNNIQDQPN